jgi:SNF2 family DNA or RNA helicase
MEINNIIDIGKRQLKDFQKDILDECLKRDSGGLSLTMGSGKTLISILLSLEQIKNTKKPILVVVSKTLIESWVHEINKFFGDKIKYKIFHSEYIKKIENFTIKPEDNTILYITTTEVLSKYYKRENINDYFIRQTIVNEGMFNQHFINNYNFPLEPYSNIFIGGSILYSTEWGCILIDEVQNYTKISTIKCQSIASLCSKHRWALSGTMFNEPSVERILGYYLIINDIFFPRNLPDTEKLIKSDKFEGINNSLVIRKNNPLFVKPKVNQHIITHDLSLQEKNMYLSMKNLLLNINKQVNRFKALGDTANTRKFSTYKLAIITYLRQTIVCSLIPISTVAVDMIDYKNRSQLSKMLYDEMEKLDLNSFLSDINSVKSSRFCEVLKIIEKHENDNIVLFTCFRTTIDILKEFLPKDRNVFIVTSTMTSVKRSKVLEEFNKGNNGKNGNILLLTYEIGSEGLNLQKIANTVLLVDFVWSDGKTSQAIARVLRYGQESKEVNIYYFISNTAIEKVIFDKHKLKLQILEELEKGGMKTNMTKITVKDIIKIIEKEENLNTLSEIHRFKNY